MPELTQAQLNELEDLLQQSREKLQQQLAISAASSEPVKLDQSAVGRVSRVDAIQQQHMAVSTRQQTQQRLKRITNALGHLAEGDYGYCQDCDELIGWPRLQVQPEAPYCLACQQSRDDSD